MFLRRRHERSLRVSRWAALVLLALVPAVVGEVPATAQTAPSARLTLQGGHEGTTRFEPGATLVLGLDAQNPAGSPAADLYVGVVLPDGVTVVVLGASGALGAVGSLAAPATLLPTTSLGPAGAIATPAFFTFAFPFTFPTPGVAAGTYQLFAALVRAGALADNRIDPGDVLALDVQPLVHRLHNNLEARLERLVTRNGATLDRVLHVAVDVPVGTARQATVTGGPLLGRVLSPGSQRIDEQGRRFDVLGGGERIVVPSFPSPGTIFTFTVTAASGAQQTFQDVLHNVATDEAIAITNLTGFAIADARLGQPLEVRWTLPTSFPVAEVSLRGVVFNAEGTFCDVPTQELPSTATAGTVTLPTTCGSRPTTRTNVCVFVTGRDDQVTTACHFHEQ